MPGLAPIVAPAFSVNLIPVITVVPYTIGDALGARLDIAATCPYPSNKGAPIILLQSLSVLDKGYQKVDFDLHIFVAEYTDPGDNTAFALNAADASKWRGVVPVRSTNYYDIVAASIAGAQVRIAGIAFPVRGGVIYAQARVLGTPTYAVADLEFNLNGIFS